jgi:hypothetical protein
MAQIKIEDVMDHLSYEMKRALEDAVNSEVRGAKFDRDNLFRAFKRAVYRKCSTWENVPDHLVKA